jgi:hypothetical protein
LPLLSRQAMSLLPPPLKCYGRKEAMLGIMPSMSQFRYDFKEQF